ncbi:hypothetical protein OF83DRAFT_1086425 [Amylostereum chailletii]|nr:hypothetical protein OF83DRAFT_1086425 [Amylostereum chailletii]
MYFTSLFSLSLVASIASGRPLQKRIAQTISDSTQLWVQACETAGGAAQCNTISQTAFMTLLAAGGNCDQQNAADEMVDLAKQLNNDSDMIRLAQIFVQQPRNALSLDQPDSLQVPYCQTAPKNAELNGLFHCQFAGSDFTEFSGDQTGNVPLGLSAVSPPGSCPASPQGPVPDGVQLDTLVQSPGTPAASGRAPSTDGTVADSEIPENGKDSQALNAQFAALSATSTCTEGDQACVGGSFAQCVGGTFTLTACAGGTTCAALPLVNDAGTLPSRSCTTEADAEARIAATGVTGGITGA